MIKPGDSEIIRSAGKATTVLQVFALVLIVLLASIYGDISSRYSALQDGVRENAMWSVYQLDREARTLKETLDEIVEQQKYGREKLNFLALNFNILYSRITTLEDSHFEKKFSADQRVVDLMADVKRTVHGATPLFDDIDAGNPISPASLNTLHYEIGILVRKCGDLLAYTNSTLSSDRADERNAILYLERKSLILIGILVFSVVILILMLRLQLRSLRSAGKSLESMAERVNLAYQAAEDGNRAKSQFMATMGHEIRTPLNAILGMVEVLELSPLSPEVAAGIKTIHRSGEALLDIINEILDFSKIEHGNLELECRSVDVRAMAESAVEIMRGRAVESGNQILLDLPAALSVPCIMSDPTRIRQVILNLMSNALKFTSKGTVTIRLRESQVGTQPRLRIEIEDTGIGIDHSGMEKLFQPFSQVDASITRKYGGTGLGLTICKRIVESLGGEIGVETTVGRGSTFWFEITVQPAAASVAPDVATVDVGELPKLRVLLVDDNAVNRQVASRMLEHLGQDVVVAGDGQEAVDITARQRFDLILMDMQMPVMDGIEATALIRGRRDAASRTPIVAMTANASEVDQRRCADAGMSGFRSKPVSIVVLRALLEELAPGKSLMKKAVANHSALPAAADVFDRRRAEIVDALGEEVFQELLQTFFTDATRILDGLHEAMSKGEHHRIKRMLHTLNGAAVNVGLGDIAARSSRLSAEMPSAQHIDELASAIRDRQTTLAA